MSTRANVILGILAFGAMAAAPASAEIVTVKGRATVFFADARLLALVGQSAAIGAVLEFEYSFDSTPDGPRPDTSPGYFEIVGLGSALRIVSSEMITYGSDGDVVDDYHTHTPSTTSAGVQYRVGALFFGPASIFPANDNQFVFPSNPVDLLQNATAWTDRELLLTVLDPEGTGEALDYAMQARISTIEAVAVPEPPRDADGDGVPDGVDQCSSSGTGVVNAAGCTVDQLVPCGGPNGGGEWKNHGRYVSEFVKVVNEFYRAGLLTEAARDALVTGAATSSCGS